VPNFGHWIIVIALFCVKTRKAKVHETLFDEKVKSLKVFTEKLQ